MVGFLLPVAVMMRASTLVVAIGLLVPASIVHADPILISGSGAGTSGVQLNASALFQISGNVLKVTLRNAGDSSGNGKDLAANTLTGVFFKLPTGITLSPTSAQIAAGALVQSKKCNRGACSGSTTDVGGEFAYQSGSWAGHNGNHGISSSGYIFDTAGNPIGQSAASGDVTASSSFNGLNLDRKDSLDGINFGIIAPTSDQNPFLTDVGSDMRRNPLIEGEVVFTMAISGGTLLESQISNVSFQYGTNLTDPKLPGGLRPRPVPEPATLLLFAPGLILALRRRRARKALR